MKAEQASAIVTISLMAAFADGRKDNAEREHVRRVAASLGDAAGLDFVKLHQDVLLGRANLADATAALDSRALRQLAFEMAVGVVEADGRHDAAEAAFLQRLETALALDHGKAEAAVHQALEVADAPVVGPLPGDVTPAPGTSSVPNRAELDRIILNASILNGALELLPQSMASMAIIPLQLRLVYRIGKAHGFELDRGHITDFLAAAGVGMTGQYVEQIGRKLVGGLLGKVFGKTGRAVGGMATGAAFSFATTWAIGKVAVSYYGGGRQLGTDALKGEFSQWFAQARGLQQQYAGQIAEKARTVDLAQITSSLRG
ncbi:MAG: GTPase [Zoogloeaceae bacterium]|nr:GTPase [Zoogloeaceae bacterium]